MSAGSDDVPRLRRFQFSLRGLMLCVFATAVGLSVMSLEEANLGDGLLAAATVFVILGLIHQIRDLWVTFRGRTDLSADERWGWRFAVFWRAGVACVLAGHYLVRFLLQGKLISLPEREDFIFAFLNLGTQLRDALFYLSLLIALASVRQSARKHRTSPRSRLVSLLAGIAAVLWCLLVWADHTLVHFLIRTAFQGIGMAQPLRLSQAGIDICGPADPFWFFWWSLFAAGFVLVNLGLIHQLARQWVRGPRRRLIWAGALTVGLAVTAAYPVWFYTSGLRTVSPILGQVMEAGPLHLWVTAVLAVIVLITAATFRTVAIPQQSGSNTGLNWRRKPQAYHHERGAVALLMGAGLIGKFAPRFCSFDGGIAWLWVEYAPFNVSMYLPATVLLLGLRNTFTGWFRPVGLQPSAPARLPLARFCAIWVATFATAVFGIPTIVGFSFAVWFSPWYLLPWP